MDKMNIPPPDEMTWTFEYGGVTGRGDNSYETGVKITYAEHVVTIEVGNDTVRLAEGSVGAKVGLAVYGALSFSERT